MLSVVIPAYNEEKNIAKCLDSLVAQRTSQKFEVILVDNNSNDNTVRIAKSYSDKLSLRIIREKQQGRGAARASGFKAAQSDIVLSTDSDTVVPRDWVKRTAKLMRNQSIVAVTGPCRIDDCGFFTNLAFNFVQPLSMIVYKFTYGHYWLSGFNFAVRKEAYEQAGGFDVTMTSMEDVELAERVAKIGQITFMLWPKVTFSGRRFQKSLAKGLFVYVKLHFQYKYLKKKDVVLHDIR